MPNTFIIRRGFQQAQRFAVDENGAITAVDAGSPAISRTMKKGLQAEANESRRENRRAGKKKAGRVLGTIAKGIIGTAVPGGAIATTGIEALVEGGELSRRQRRRKDRSQRRADRRDD